MSGRVIRALYKKEIFDILRDKKTILMMIIIPLVVYPLMFIGSMMVARTIMTENTVKTYTVSFADDALEAELKTFIFEHQDAYSYHFAFVKDEQKTPAERLEELSIDAYISATIEDGEKIYHICYNASNANSSNAGAMLDDMLREYNNYIRDEMLREQGLVPQELLYPISYTMDDYSSNEETMGMLLGYAMPFMLIVSILMGAMYPAIDTTAGEKERGTLETLMTLPVKSIELIVSKFLATASVAIGAALLNVLSMGLLGGYFYTSMQATSAVGFAFSLSAYIPSLLITLLGAVVFAMFASAVCLCFCIFAKSFKEAQNLTTPLMLVFLVASMASILPSASLKGAACYIPVVNLSLLVRELFSFHINGSAVLIVLLSNLAYSALAIVIMTKLFCVEDVLFGDGVGSIRLIEKRSEMKKGQMPGIGDLILLMSILLIVVLFVGSTAAVKFGLRGLSFEQLLIGGIPLFYAWYMKADMKKLFSLKKPGLLNTIGALFIGVGMLLANGMLTSLLTLVFPKSIEGANELLYLFHGVSFIEVFLIVAVAPAICEELAFRGFLFGILKNKFKPFIAIAIIGALFGLYHMNIIKFFAVGLLGGVMAYVVWKTGSIFLGMLIHLMNNGFSVFMAMKPAAMEKAFPILYKAPLTGKDLAVLGAIILASLITGFLLINRGNRKKKLGVKDETSN